MEVAGVGYLAVGSIDNAGSGKSFDAIMTTVSTEGAVIRTTSYGGVNEESYEGVAKAPDGTIYAVGFTSSPLVDGFGTTYGSEDMLVTKIAADGQTLA